jgi:hypothetical protein
MKPKGKRTLRTVATLLIYILQKISCTKLNIFQRSTTIHHFTTLNEVFLVLLQPHKFAGSPYCYQMDVKKINMTLGCPPMAEFVKIGHLVQM